MNRIFLLEDDKDLRDSLATMLEFEGYQTIGAKNGSIGLSLIQSECPDLIVCDVNLPGLDGLSMLAQLRQDPDTADIPVIMLTGNVSAERHLAALRLNIDAYLFKPCSIQRLLTEIQRSLSKARSFIAA